MPQARTFVCSGCAYAASARTFVYICKKNKARQSKEANRWSPHKHGSKLVSDARNGLATTLAKVAKRVQL